MSENDFVMFTYIILKHALIVRLLWYKINKRIQREKNQHPINA